MPTTARNYTLVTGASSGIGREIARQLAGRELNLVITGRNGESLEHLKTEISLINNIDVVVIPCDLSVPGAAIELYQACKTKQLVVETLINNAGQGMFGNAIDQDDDRIERMLVLNIISPTTLSGMFARDMKERGKGHIMNVGSLAGNQPTPFFGSYSASKAYIFDYSVALHYELRTSGVVVTCFIPGFVKTAFDANAHIANHRYLSFSERNALPADRVAGLAIEAMVKGKLISIGGFSNSVITFLTKLIPYKLKAAAIHKVMGWLTA